MEENNKYHITRMVATIGSDDPNDTRACRLHNRSMVNRVWRPERHEGVSSTQSGRVISIIIAYTDFIYARVR